MNKSQYYSQLSQALRMYERIASNNGLLDSKDGEIRRVAAKLIYANLTDFEAVFSEDVRKDLSEGASALKKKCLEILSS